MNYDRDAMIAAANTNATASGDYEKSQFLKLKPGNHQIRPLPVGNATQKLPFKTVTQHVLPGANETGKYLPKFVLCWHWMFSTPEQQQSTVRDLAQMQKLTKADLEKYKQHGCPVCKAVVALDAAGFEKTKVANLKPKTAHLWNVVLRSQNPASESDSVYVWSLSKKLHDQIMSSVVQGLNGTPPMDILDIQAGFDWAVRAEGEGLQRRYTMSMWPQVKPVTGDIQPYNLVEIAATSFRNYQETIDLVKESIGNFLTQIGHKIGGDETWNKISGAVTQEANVVPAYQQPNLTPTSPFPAPAEVPWVAPAPVAAKKPAGFDPETNTIYDENGKALF